MGSSNNTPETKFFLTAPQGYVVAAYAIIQLLLIIVGVIFPMQGLVVVIISIIALLVTIAIVLMLHKSVDYIESKDDKVETATDWRKDALIAIETLKSEMTCDDDLFSSLVDEIKFSDPMSNKATASIEAEILDITKFLSKESDVEQQIEDVRNLVRKRNSICKLSK